MEVNELEKDFLFKFSMPLSVKIHGKRNVKNYIFNLNNYLHWHYMIYDKLKKWYAEQFITQNGFQRYPIKSLISLHYVLWKKSKRKTDRANVLCVHEKFACDAMVLAGYLKDDSDEFIYSSTYYTGGVDKKNPRVDIYLRNVK